MYVADSKGHIDLTRSRVDGVMDRPGWKTLLVGFAKIAGGV